MSGLRGDLACAQGFSPLPSLLAATPALCLLLRTVPLRRRSGARRWRAGCVGRGKICLNFSVRKSGRAFTSSIKLFGPFSPKKNRQPARPFGFPPCGCLCAVFARHCPALTPTFRVCARRCLGVWWCVCACVGGVASVWKPPKKPRARPSRCVSRSGLGLVPDPRRLLQPPVPVGKVACGFVVRDSNSLSAPVSSLLRTDRCSRLSLLSLPGSCCSVVSVAKPPKTLRARSSRCVSRTGLGAVSDPRRPL